MNYYTPSIPSALPSSLYSPANVGLIVCGSNMNAHSSLSSSTVFTPVDFHGMFPKALHRSRVPAVRHELSLKVQEADVQTRFPASFGSIRAPRPQRPAPVDGFLQATQGQTVDLFKGWPVSTGYQSMNDATGTDGSGAYFGVNSQLPKIWT